MLSTRTDEAIFARALRRVGLEPIAQYPVDQYRIDLALITDQQKLAIEIDGRRHHTGDDGYRLHEDLLRDARLRDLGWEVLRFWVEDIRLDPEACASQVQSHMKQ